MPTNREIRTIAIGALATASMVPLLTALVSWVDENESVPLLAQVPIVLVYWVVTIPGAILDGRGWWTMSFVSLFWAIAGAVVAYYWMKARRREQAS